jgi:hypothetical protein
MSQFLHPDDVTSLIGTAECHGTRFGNTTPLTSFLYDFNANFLYKSDAKFDMAVFVEIIGNVGWKEDGSNESEVVVRSLSGRI